MLNFCQNNLEVDGMSIPCPEFLEMRIKVDRGSFRQVWRDSGCNEAMGYGDYFLGFALEGLKCSPEELRNPVTGWRFREVWQ